jgi:hypothetical protein
MLSLRIFSTLSTSHKTLNFEALFDNVYVILVVFSFRFFSPEEGTIYLCPPTISYDVTLYRKQVNLTGVNNVPNILLIIFTDPY